MGAFLKPSIERKGVILALRLADRWIWDSWYVWDGDYCHAFYLCASKGLVDPNRRHRYTNIGHARSKDLTNWEILPDVLSPSDSPAFDSWTTWTGSVVRDDTGLWWLFYTGTSREDGGDIQRIGSATSKDLISWTKSSADTVIEADASWYEKLGDKTWVDEAWRDPWVYRSGQDNLWHMLITARAKNGANRNQGVLGHAISKDLKTWEVKAPLSDPDQGFAQLEVFQRVTVDSVPLLIFCCGYRELDDHFLTLTGEFDATYSLVCDEKLQDVDFRKARAFSDKRIYAGRVVQDPQGGSYLLGFVNMVEGQFVGEICDPIPVSATFEEGLVIKEAL
jgi:beta-fructofuranosidase